MSHLFRRIRGWLRARLTPAYWTAQRLVRRAGLWVRTEARPVHWILLGLAAAIVLGTVLPHLLCTFEYIDHGMTDGVHDYAYMNDNTGWDYRGRLRYFVGWAEDGRPVYAADKERTIIRKRKPWYQDMDNAMLHRTDVPFPDVFEDGCAVTGSIVTDVVARESYYHNGKLTYGYSYSTEDVRLSPKGARAFQSLLKELKALEEAGTVGQEPPTASENRFVTFIRIEHPDFPDFYYSPHVELFWIDGRIYARFRDQYCVELDQGSPLYGELKQYHDMYLQARSTK